MSVRLEPTSDSGDIEATSSARGGNTIGKHHWSKIKRQWPAAVCCALYIVLAMIVYGHFSSLGPSHMTGSLSSDVIVQVWWLAWTAFALLTATMSSWPSGRTIRRPEFRGEHLNACSRCAVHADYQVIRASSHLEHCAACRRCIVGEFDVPRAPPLDDVVARSLRRRTHLRPFRLYGLLVGSSDLFLACVPLPPVIFTPPRDPGAPALAAWKNGGPSRTALCPSVLHLARGPCRNGRDGCDRVAYSC